MLGFTAHNIIKGDMKIFQFHDVSKIDTTVDFIIDVRTPEEYELGSIAGAVNIPVDDLRSRLSEIPKNRKLFVFCQVGIRGYIAYRILVQNGYDEVYNLTGGYKLYHTVSLDQSAEFPQDKFGLPDAVEGEGETLVVPEARKAAMAKEPAKTLRVDACGLQCPGPILKVAEGVKQIEAGDQLVIEATDPGFASDIGVWCERTGNQLDGIESKGGTITVTLTKGGPVTAPVAMGAGNDKTIVVFSGELDKALAAFIIATGAAAMGRKVTMFFTFWGLTILRRTEAVPVKKNLIEKMFGFMLPTGAKKLGLSRMNMGGAGTAMMRAIMKSKNVASLEELIESALEYGVKIVACQMSMDVMGIKPEELIDGVEIGGVATMLGAAETSDTNLFI